MYLAGKDSVMRRFDYLHNTMGLSHRDILQWPTILKIASQKLISRHQFLKLLGRDQFDPKKPNYITMEECFTGTSEKFCEKVAKVPHEHFVNFLKTL